MRPELSPEHRVFARALTRTAARDDTEHTVRELLALAGHERSVLDRALDHGRVLLHVVGRDEVCEGAIHLVRTARDSLDTAPVTA